MDDIKYAISALKPSTLANKALQRKPRSPLGFDSFSISIAKFKIHHYTCVTAHSVGQRLWIWDTVYRCLWWLCANSSSSDTGRKIRCFTRFLWIWDTLDSKASVGYLACGQITYLYFLLSCRPVCAFMCWSPTQRLVNVSNILVVLMAWNCSWLYLFLRLDTRRLGLVYVS